MKVLGFIFGALGGFVAGMIFTKSAVIGGVGAAIGGIVVGAIGSCIGEKAVESEADSLSGEGHSVAGAIFWWFILFLIGAAALIFFGLSK